MHRRAHTHAHTQQMNENEQATTTTPQFQPLCAPHRPMRMRNRRVRLLPFSYATKTTTAAAEQQQHIRSSPDLRRMKGQTPKRKNYYFSHTPRYTRTITRLSVHLVKSEISQKNNLQIKHTKPHTKNKTTATTSSRV